MTDLTASTELLGRELPGPRFADDGYLSWLYEANPWGAAFQGNVDEDGVRLAHYALIPQEYRDASGAVPGVFSLNAVTRSGTQRKGLFTRVGLELYERAGAAGRRFAVGVCNEKSIGAVTKYMGWTNCGGLPVRLCAPLARARGVEHYVGDEPFLAGGELDAIAAEVDGVPARGLTNRWTAAHLRWRLSRPDARYAVHVGDDLVAVSTRTRSFGVPAAVVMKLLPRAGRSGPLASAPLISAVCRFHRAPFAVYAGSNAHVPVRGVQPPRRLLPSPLYLILRSLQPEVDQAALRLDTFEFLDMDAY